MLCKDGMIIIVLHARPVPGMAGKPPCSGCVGVAEEPKMPLAYMVARVVQL